jgi:type I restriction enzyme S subunit
MKLEPFNAILSDCTSKYNKIKKENYLAEGQFPIIDQGQKFFGGYTDDGGLITDIEKELIIFGDHTKILKFIDFPIAIGADGVKVLHVNKEKADPRYIYYFLKSVKLTDAGYSRHFKFLKEIKIPVPENMDDQIKIARVLNHVETLITRRKESIAILDKLLESKFYEMFGDPVKNEKNWDKDDFENLVAQECPLTYGIVQPGDEFANGIPVIRPVDLTKTYINRNGLKLIDPEISNKFKRTLLKGNEILMCVRGTTGVVALASNELDGCNVTRGIVPIWFSENYNKYFAFSLLKTKALNIKIQDLTYGATLQQINLSDLRKISLINPPIKLQNKFSLIVNKIENLKVDYNNSLIKLENMLGALSQIAFNGNLILNQDDIKKKNKEVMEQNDLEQYSKSIDLKKEKVDITNMSFDEYYEIPGEVTFKNEKWITYFLHDDLLYQFLLKDKFKDISFTLGDIEMQLHDFFYHTCDMDFDNEKWKQVIFKFLETNPPLIEQFFDDKTAIIKLKLTDEAFKA